MSRGPAEILGLNKGLIAEGYDGDVVLVELGEPYTVRREDFAARAKTPHTTAFRCTAAWRAP